MNFEKTSGPGDAATRDNFTTKKEQTLNDEDEDTRRVRSSIWIDRGEGEADPRELSRDSMPAPALTVLTSARRSENGGDISNGGWAQANSQGSGLSGTQAIDHLNSLLEEYLDGQKKKEHGAHALAKEKQTNASTKGEQSRRRKKKNETDTEEDKNQSAIRFDPDEADVFLTEWRRTRGHDSMDSPRNSKLTSSDCRRSRDRVSVESPRGGWASRPREGIGREGIGLGQNLDLEAPFSKEDEYVKNLIMENEYAEPEVEKTADDEDARVRPDLLDPQRPQRASVKFEASEQHHSRNRGHDSMENRLFVALAESRRSRDRPSTEDLEKERWTKTNSPPGPRMFSFDSGNELAGFFLDDGCVPEWVNQQEEWESGRTGEGVNKQEEWVNSQHAVESSADIPDIPMWDTMFWHRTPKAPSSQPVAEEQDEDSDPVISPEAPPAATEAPLRLPTAEELAVIQHLMAHQNQWGQPGWPLEGEQPLPSTSQNALMSLLEEQLADMVAAPHTQLGSQGDDPVPVSADPSSGDGQLRVFK